MSWHYSQEQAEGYSEGSYSVILASELVRSKPIPGKSFLHDSETESSHPSQSGTTFAHSEAITLNAENTSITCDLSETTSLSQEDFHARIYPLRETQKALRESVQAFGVRWRELSVRYDRKKSLWKTHRCLFPEDLQESSVTFPKWGILVDGVCWEQTTWEHHTSEKGSGYWRTPQAANGKQGPKSLAYYKHCLQTPNTPQISLVDQVRHWPTPTASDHKGAGKNGDLRDRLDYAVERGGTKSKQYEQPVPNGGQLNPDWVEWLMGWPIGHTDLEPLEMGKYRKWLSLHGIFYTETQTTNERLNDE